MGCKVLQDFVLSFLPRCSSPGKQWNESDDRNLELNLDLSKKPEESRYSLIQMWISQKFNGTFLQESYVISDGGENKSVEIFFKLSAAHLLLRCGEIQASPGDPFINEWY